MAKKQELDEEEFDREELEEHKEEIIEILNEALKFISEAVDSLKDAQNLMEDLSYGYSIIGNMDSYVINYLSDGANSIENKIQKYIEQTEELT